MFNLLNKDGGIMQKMEMNGNGLDWVNDFWMMVDDGIVDWMIWRLDCGLDDMEIGLWIG